MVLLISQERLLHTEVLLVQDEIKLVRQVLDWKHKPFEIPKNILNEWRKIGNKGIKLESSWRKFIRKKSKL